MLLKFADVTGGLYQLWQKIVANNGIRSVRQADYRSAQASSRVVALAMNKLAPRQVMITVRTELFQLRLPCQVCAMRRDGEDVQKVLLSSVEIVLDGLADI